MDFDTQQATPHIYNWVCGCLAKWYLTWLYSPGEENSNSINYSIVLTSEHVELFIFPLSILF